MGVHARHDAVFIDRLTVTLAFWMPKMKHFRSHESIFPLNAQMTESKNKVGIFMAPSLEGFVEPIDADEITSPNAEVTASDSAPLKALLYPE